MSITRLALIGLMATAMSATAARPAAAQVGTWSLQGRIHVSVTARGRTVTQSESFRGVALIVASDGTYSQPGTLLCEGSDEGGEIAVSEVGTWRPVRRKRFVLEPTNVDELTDLVSDCLGGDLDISLTAHDYRHVIKPLHGGSRLRGKTIFRGRIRLDGRSFAARAVARYVGTPTAEELSALARGAGWPALSLQARSLFAEP